MMPSGRTLFISYNGALEPLGQSQVIPYLKGLSENGLSVALLTFEKADAFSQDRSEERSQLKSILSRSSIAWYALRYHKRPSLVATLFDIVWGILISSSIVMTQKIQVVHARSYVPAVIALALKKLFRIKWIFDMRGFMAEEFEDAGLWKRNDLKFKLVKFMERRFLKSADSIVVLTKKAKGILQTFDVPQGCSTPITVIPCCVDLKQFTPHCPDLIGEKFKRHDRTVLTYIGSLGSWYLAAEMVDFFAVAKGLIPNLYFLILTQSNHAMIKNLLEHKGLTAQQDYEVKMVAPREVPGYLKTSDIGISLIKPCFSKLASSPTKIGEYLACGLPIMTNRGIGDLDELIEEEGIGVIIEEWSLAAYQHAVEQFISLLAQPGIRERCREVARKHFSLGEIGVPRYLDVYEKLQ
ncbi:MAG: glycosyltransferase [Candidatus Tectomicrobia bacterium]|nr:glycosyltransferase [Candidatus Tectomicrobia bacterium]